LSKVQYLKNYMNQKPLNQKYIQMLLLLLVTFAQAAIDIYLPSLPSMTREFHTQNEMVQYSLSVFVMGMIFSQLIFGALSDRYGRRKILLICLEIFLVATLFCIFAPSIQTLLIARFFQGFGIGATFALARTIASDSFQGKERAKITASLSFAWSVVPMIAPLLGSYIQEYFNWRMNFIFLFVYVGTGFILFWRYLPETHTDCNLQALHIKALARSYMGLFTNKIFLSGCFAVMLLNVTFFAYSTAAPFLFQDCLHLTIVQYGWLIFLITFVYFCGSFFNNRLINHIPFKKIAPFLFTIYLTAALIMFLIAAVGIMNIAVILVPMIVIFCGDAFIYPYFMLQSMNAYPKTSSGNASSVYGLIAQTGSFLGTVAIAKTPEYNQVPLAAVVLICVSLATIIFCSCSR
jgi:MFS transporter, DHA1 family, multidrug resistance protein